LALFHAYSFFSLTGEFFLVWQASVVSFTLGILLNGFLAKSDPLPLVGILPYVWVGTSIVTCPWPFILHWHRKTAQGQADVDEVNRSEAADKQLREFIKRLEDEREIQTNKTE
jgi:hypothetical protein